MQFEWALFFLSTFLSLSPSHTRYVSIHRFHPSQNAGVAYRTILVVQFLREHSSSWPNDWWFDWPTAQGTKHRYRQAKQGKLPGAVEQVAFLLSSSSYLTWCLRRCKWSSQSFVVNWSWHRNKSSISSSDDVQWSACIESWLEPPRRYLALDRSRSILFVLLHLLTVPWILKKPSWVAPVNYWETPSPHRCWSTNIVQFLVDTWSMVTVLHGIDEIIDSNAEQETVSHRWFLPWTRSFRRLCKNFDG